MRTDLNFLFYAYELDSQGQRMPAVPIMAGYDSYLSQKFRG